MSPCPVSRSRRALSRGGFTIVELMIVVSIIAVLMALTLQVVGAFITQAREAATQATIRKIQGLLNSRAEALQRLTMRTGYLATTPEYNSNEVVYLSNGNVNLRSILAKKQIHRTYFPQRSAEIVNQVLYPDLVNLSLSNPEILCAVLTGSGVVGDPPPGTDAFSTSEIATGPNGRQQFTDAWGNPIRFYRWPTRLFRQPVNTGDPSAYWTSLSNVNAVDATNAQFLFSTLPSFSGNLSFDLSRDPDDPLRRCAAFNPYKSGSDAPFNVDFEQAGNLGYHTAATYHVLLVVSPGPDGVLGLYEPDEIDTTNNIRGDLAQVKNADDLADDITYLNIRAGGK